MYIFTTLFTHTHQFHSFSYMHTNIECSRQNQSIVKDIEKPFATGPCPVTGAVSYICLIKTHHISDPFHACIHTHTFKHLHSEGHRGDAICPVRGAAQ